MAEINNQTMNATMPFGINQTMNATSINQAEGPMVGNATVTMPRRNHTGMHGHNHNGALRSERIANIVLGSIVGVGVLVGIGYLFYVYVYKRRSTFLNRFFKRTNNAEEQTTSVVTANDGEFMNYQQFSDEEKMLQPVVMTETQQPQAQ